MTKVVLAGPPRSGKSCLREGLKQAILAFQCEHSGVPYPYVITACPDGEGAWFQETTKKYPEIAKACKDAYKGKFTEEFVRLVANHVRNCEQPLTMVDIGGKVDDYNCEICKSATHIVILAGNDPETGECWNDRMDEWRKFAEGLNLVVVAEIFSDYKGQKDVVKGVCPDNILRGSVHYLERGEPIETRPMVRALARHILTIVGKPLESTYNIASEDRIVSPQGQAQQRSETTESTYNIARENNVLRVRFGRPANNDQIVKDVVVRLDEMYRSGDLSGGGLIKIDGPASLPVAMVLAHKLSHLFSAIACSDPKLNKYVVVISHSPDFAVGDLI